MVESNPNLQPNTRQRTWRGRFLSSRIARLIFASNLAGLAVLIVGALVLNEMRAGFVASKKQDLIAQAEVFSSLIGAGGTTPTPALDPAGARETLVALKLPSRIRARIYDLDSELVGDSFYLSERVDIDALPPMQDASNITRWGTGLSQWASSIISPLRSNANQQATLTRTFEEEFDAAKLGDQAASQRISDRGQRIISVSVPIQRVSAVVGVLTVESNDIDEIIRAERAALVPFIGVALLVALLTSFLLTLGIARPMRRLSIAADDIRSGAADQIDLPQLVERKDEIGNLARSMHAMTDALLERIEANEQFAADVAHELKNPLTSIRSAVETAERVQGDPEASARLRELISSDVKRLDRLITDISNASRLEAEMTRIPNARIEIASFLSEVVSTYTAVAEAGVEIPVTFKDATHGARLMVKGREGPLGQVFRNLIDNARSFSPKDGMVCVTLEQTNDGPQTIARIIVEDEGPGIPKDKLEKIFDRFYTDRPKGTAFGNNSGLGLSIVKQIIQTHRGKVFAENKDEGGARFIVDLAAF